MEKELKEGLSFKQTITVETKHTAKTWGSGNLDVYATPAMVGLMENTALKCISEYIEEGNDTVGIEINTQHIKATLVGKEVSCEAVLTKVDGKKLFFEIKAWDEVGEIGSSKHTRFIINTEKFLNRLK
ncbi:MAG: thioesterase family protein [Marinifilaceae bacterium]